MLGVQQASVALYAPLLLPLGLELGGFIFLALGLAPRRREEDGTATSPAGPEVAESVTVAMPAVADPKPALVSKGGKAYYMQRLQRDYPAIAKRVQDGELSVYAASIEAGIRKSAGKSKWTQPAAYLQKADA